MTEENLDPGASAPEPEPAPTEEVTPVTDPPAEETPAEEVVPVESESESTEASEPPAEAIVEDDPFAEFENAVKDKSYYENAFKTDPELKHTPHTARKLLYAEVEAKAAVEAEIEAVGGRATLATLKPVTDVLSDPNPTPEMIETAFEAIDNHNSKVIEGLGASFTKNWVQEVVKDPIQNLSPLMQHVFAQTFGKGASEYDLNRVLEFIQLDMARDPDGDPILDLAAAREAFEINGGFNAFKYQQEKADYERQINELKNGYQQNGQPAPVQPTQPDIDVDTDLETENLPKAEAFLARIGYAKDDPEYSLVMDAMKYRLRHAPETERIRGFAKNGSYKTAEGNFVQGVQNNREYLGNRVYAQLVKEMKGVQERRKAATSPSATKLEPTPKVEPEKPKVEAPKERDPNKELTVEDIIQEAADNAKKRKADDEAAMALAAGR